MVSENLNNETEIRRFLLGEMNEDERVAFEESFVGGEELFEQIRVAEDELIEAYVRETLDPSDRERFEKSFLTTGKRRERVAFTRAMLVELPKYREAPAVKKIETAAKKSSVRDLIAAFFKTPKLIFGAALAVLFLIFGFWFLILKASKDQIEIVRETTPTPAVSVSPPVIENNSNINSTDNSANKIPANNGNANKNQNAANANRSEKEISPPKTIVAVALFPGALRSGGKTSELNLPKDAGAANLQLNLESEDYKTYRFEIVNADGAPVFRSGRLNSKNSKINAFVPAEKLPRGDYLVKLYGFNAQNQEESAADYQFRVNRK